MQPARAAPWRPPGATSRIPQKYADLPAKKGLEPAGFGIFVDPVHCKGCAECVEVCHALGYDALRMIDKVAQEPTGESTLDRYVRDIAFFRSLPPTPAAYRSDKALADLMLGEHAIGYVGGAGSCAGCGEATAIRMLVAATRQVHGPESMGIVAATGCNTVYGSTYPYNPYLVPWTNSLFENAPADAMGIRARWDQAGHPTAGCGCSAATAPCTTSASNQAFPHGRLGARPQELVILDTAGLFEYRRPGLDRHLSGGG